MNRAGRLIESIASWDNVAEAYRKASRGKKTKPDVQFFAERFGEEAESLIYGIMSGSVRVGDYHYFRIFDPKERLICAASFRERVLHHAIMNVCHKYFERHFIYETYATRPYKGLYKALERGQEAARSRRWVAKFDFRKYFDSIDHEILKRSLERLFKDRLLLDLFGKIIDSYCVSPGKGVPIGNLTSQYFANYYLSGMDHYIKESLRVKYYCRYMDDFLIFDSDRSHLKGIVKAVEAFAKERLRLELKPVLISPVDAGVSFLGYKVYPNKLLLNRRSRNRLKDRLLSYNDYLESAEWSEAEYLNHITPVLSFARKAYTKSLRHSILENLSAI